MRQDSSEDIIQGLILERQELKKALHNVREELAVLQVAREQYEDHSSHLMHCALEGNISLIDEIFADDQRYRKAG